MKKLHGSLSKIQEISTQTPNMDRQSGPSRAQGRMIVDLKARKRVGTGDIIHQREGKIQALNNKPKYREGTRNDILELVKAHNGQDEGVFLKKINPENKILIEDILPTGGFSKSICVYRDPENSSMSYVCKVVKSEKFHKNEVINMCQLNDESICQLYGLVCKTDEYHIYMEYCGMNLRQLTYMIPFTFDHILDITKQLCMAVEFAHNKRIIHLDIKPDNICLLFSTGKFTLKLTDWGSSTTAFSYENLSFTLLYAPPELLYRYLCQMLNHSKLNEQMKLEAVDLAQKFTRNYNSIENVSTKADSFSIGLTIMFVKTREHPYGKVAGHFELFKMFAEDPNAAYNLCPDYGDFLTDIAKLLVKGKSHERASVKDIQKRISDYTNSQCFNAEDNQPDDPPHQDDQDYNVPDLDQLLSD